MLGSLEVLPAGSWGMLPVESVGILLSMGSRGVLPFMGSEGVLPSMGSAEVLPSMGSMGVLPSMGSYGFLLSNGSAGSLGMPPAWLVGVLPSVRSVLSAESVGVLPLVECVEMLPVGVSIGGVSGRAPARSVRVLSFVKSVGVLPFVESVGELPRGQ